MHQKSCREHVLRIDLFAPNNFCFGLNFVIESKKQKDTGMARHGTNIGCPRHKNKIVFCIFDMWMKQSLKNQSQPRGYAPYDKFNCGIWVWTIA